MGSFFMEEFVGNGALKELVPKLLEEGWDDVPTLKMMNAEDTEALNMTVQQKEALQIRAYLHDRALMQYGDKLESSAKSLPELLALSTAALASQFGMKRGHVARFTDRTPACGPITMPPSHTLLARRRSTARSLQSLSSKTMQQSVPRSPNRTNNISDGSLEHSIAEIKIKEGHVFKGIVAAEPAEARVCGCVQPPPIVDSVAPYSAIESISVQKLTPEYKIGMERLVKTKTPPMKASELWREKPAVLLCIRRPGVVSPQLVILFVPIFKVVSQWLVYKTDRCIMCRAEAHQLYSRKPIFDALGFQLIAVLHEQIDSEVRDFWPRYWGGVVVHDRSMDFFKALGGGKLNKDKFITGFVLNPRAIANYKRAKAMGVEQNFKGEGEIKGGLFIVGSGKTGIAYQFIERNFGDWAPHAEIIEICTRLQKHHNGYGSQSIQQP